MKPPVQQPLTLQVPTISISHFQSTGRTQNVTVIKRHKPWFTYHDAIGLLCLRIKIIPMFGTASILSFFVKFWDGFGLRITAPGGDEESAGGSDCEVSCEAFLHPGAGYTVDGSPCFGINHRWLAVHTIPHVFIGGSAVPSLLLRPCDVASVAKWPLGLMNIYSGIAPLAVVHLFVLAKT